MKINRIGYLTILCLSLSLAIILNTSIAMAQVSIKEQQMYFGEEVINFGDFSKSVAEFCKVNIIVPDKLKGKKIFILSAEGFSKTELWENYLWMIEMMGVTFSSAGEYKTMRSNKDVARIPTKLHLNNLPTTTEKQPYVNFMYQLKHLSPDEVIKVLQKFKSKNSKILTFDNKLLFIEMQSRLPWLIKLLKELDVGSTSSKVYFWIAQNSPISDISKIVEQLFLKGGKGKATATGLEQLVTDDRTNGIFIVGTEESCKKVIAFLPKLDIGLERSTDMEVVFLKFAKADELASTLQSVVKVGRKKSSKQKEFGEDLEVKITSDKQTNALVLVGPPRGIASLKKVITKLDIFPSQVFLEVAILEVSIGDTSKLGVSLSSAKKVSDDTYLAGSTNYGGLSSYALDPASLIGMAIGASAGSVDGSGDAFNLGNDLPKFGVLLNMLKTMSEVNVVANPYLMAMDTEEAEIIVGSNVPFITGTSRDSRNNPVLSIQRQDIALTLKVLPEINKQGQIKMKLEISIEDLASLSETMGPTTTKRAVKTTVLTRSGSRIAIGGLLKQNALNDEEKIPFFGEIPVIGRLFQTSKKSGSKTNLMIVITPHILHNPDDIKRIFANKLKEREEYIREMYGEETDYEISKDYHDRVGVVEIIKNVVEEHKRKHAESGSEQMILITPKGVSKFNEDEEIPLSSEDDSPVAPKPEHEPLPASPPEPDEESFPSSAPPPEY